jgi:hypothetical protein
LISCGLKSHPVEFLILLGRVVDQLPDNEVIGLINIAKHIVSERNVVENLVRYFWKYVFKMKLQSSVDLAAQINMNVEIVLSSMAQNESSFCPVLFRLNRYRFQFDIDHGESFLSSFVNAISVCHVEAV